MTIEKFDEACNIDADTNSIKQVISDIDQDKAFSDIFAYFTNEGIKKKTLSYIKNLCKKEIQNNNNKFKKL